MVCDVFIVELKIVRILWEGTDTNKGTQDRGQRGVTSSVAIHDESSDSNQSCFENEEGE